MGLFKKKNEKIIQKAHGMIDEINRVDKENSRIIINWNKELKKAKTAKERARIDSKYESLDKRLEKTGDKVYDKYYSYINKMFPEMGKSNSADLFLDLEDKFIDKKLIERLVKLKK